jgi:hypothetical protein
VALPVALPAVCVAYHTGVPAGGWHGRHAHQFTSSSTHRLSKLHHVDPFFSGPAQSSTQLFLQAPAGLAAVLVNRVVLPSVLQLFMPSSHSCC